MTIGKFGHVAAQFCPICKGVLQIGKVQGKQKILVYCLDMVGCGWQQILHYNEIKKIAIGLYSELLHNKLYDKLETKR